MFVERLHSNNQKRARRASGKVTAWRRQSSISFLFQSRDRFARTSKEHAARLKLIGETTWKEYADKTAPATRAGIGLNPKFAYINQRSKERAGQGISFNDFKGLRRQWAQQVTESMEASSALGPGAGGNAAAESKKAFSSALQKRRELRAQLGAKAGRDLQAYDENTHFGMGSFSLPIHPGRLSSRLQTMGRATGSFARGGLRRLSGNVLKETDIVVPKSNRIMWVDRKKTCCNLHPGVCRSRDSALFSSCQAIVNSIRQAESFESSGTMVLQFRFVHVAEGGDIVVDKDP